MNNLKRLGRKVLISQIRGGYFFTVFYFTVTGYFFPLVIFLHANFFGLENLILPSWSSKEMALNLHSTGKGGNR